MALDLRDIRANTSKYAGRDSGWEEGFAGPCAICSRPVKEGSGVMVHLHGGGGTVVTEAEAQAGMTAEGETLNPNADLGGYPIGPECYRKNKAALKPYVAA